jgi:hypothetical protein
MSELKCCPFCGGEAELKKFYETCDGRGDRMARVECKCGLGMSLTWNEFKQAEKDFDYSGGYYSSNKEFWEGMHQKLVDKWNTRNPMANIVEKLEELKKNDDCLAYCYQFYSKTCDIYEKAINIVKQEINNGLE